MSKTQGYGGRRYHKSILVETNDPKKPKIILKISGKVEKFAEIEPQNVKLSGSVKKTVMATVKIKPRKKFPFKITSIGTKTGKFIKIELKQKSSTGHSGYTLIVKNTKNTAGRYSDIIYINTDSNIKSKIKIRVFGNIVKQNKR